MRGVVSSAEARTWPARKDPASHGAIAVPTPAVPVQPQVDAHPDKFLGIELLRFVTAAAVLVFHYQHFYSARSSFDATQQPFYSALSFFYNHGYYGVQVFWCISGFIFFARYGSSVASGRETGRDFALARFSRLYPLHLLTLLAVAGLQYLYLEHHANPFVYANNDLPHFIGQLLMVSSWQLSFGPETYSFNGPIWSVSLELLAYIVFFVVVRFFGASAPTVLAALTITSVLDRVVGHHPAFTCIVYFYLGALIFRLHTEVSVRGWRGAALGLAVSLGVAAGLLNHIDRLPAPLATLVIAPATLLAASLMRRNASPAFGRLATALGNTTYASYLLHFPLQLVCVLLAERLRASLPLGSAWFFGSYIVGIFVAAALCHRNVELPAQQWLRKRYRRRTRLAAASSSSSSST